MQNELSLRSKKRSWDYSASSVIRHFDNLNAKILQASPTFTKATRVVATVISCKMVFSNCQSTAEFRKCIHYWREAGYLQAHGRSYTGCYGSRWSTTVAKTWKILKENVQHGHGKKIDVQLKLDEHCIGWQQWETHALLQSQCWFCSILTVF